MNTYSNRGASYDALDRPSYAKRVGLCLLGLVAYGFIVGFLSQSVGMSDPRTAMLTMIALIIIGNVVIGSYFVRFTYRRALDCSFGQNGKAWIAAVAALPTLALPNYGLLVFGVMMFFKSAPTYEEEGNVEDDTGVLRPFAAAE